ncbi:MAG: hypothetical protein QOK67_07560 [Nitrososphaeraceae archaeon]|nr:hypothetical protein [Nitrososphaeraceae archaeon]
MFPNLNLLEGTILIQEDILEIAYNNNSSSEAIHLLYKDSNPTTYCISTFFIPIGNNRRRFEISYQSTNTS